VTAVVIVAVFILSGIKPLTSDFVKIDPQSRPQAQGLSMGDPNAPVKVEEYGDFQCPACRIFHESQEGPLIENYIKTGVVYFTYIPFSFIGDESVKAAEAAYCAADQGKFWEYHDMLYANQTAENKGDFADSRLVAFADYLNMDMAKFNDCFDTRSYKKQVADDYAKAQRNQVDRTPSFIVNGQLVFSNTLFQAIEQAAQP
jgi:protein-disulfide isomerase